MGWPLLQYIISSVILLTSLNDQRPFQNIRHQSDEQRCLAPSSRKFVQYYEPSTGMILRPVDYPQQQPRTGFALCIHHQPFFSLKNSHCKVVGSKFNIRPHIICRNDTYMIICFLNCVDCTVFFFLLPPSPGPFEQLGQGHIGYVASMPIGSFCPLINAKQRTFVPNQKH